MRIVIAIISRCGDYRWFSFSLSQWPHFMQEMHNQTPHIIQNSQNSRLILTEKLILFITSKSDATMWQERSLQLTWPKL